MKYLLLVITLVFLVSCAKEDEDSLSNKYRSCTGVDSETSVNYCINFDDAGLNAGEKNAFCDSVTSATLSENDCSGISSNGVCSGVSFTYAGQAVNNLNLRYYLANATLEEAACLAAGGTWTADTGGLVIKQSTTFCEANGSCLRLNGMSRQNAQNFCDQLNGYLDNNCE